MQDWFLMFLLSRYVLTITGSQGIRRLTKCAQTTVTLARYIYNAQRAYMSEEDRISGVIMANVVWNSCFTATLSIYILNKKRKYRSTWSNALCICKRNLSTRPTQYASYHRKIDPVLFAANPPNICTYHHKQSTYVGITLYNYGYKELSYCLEF